VLCSALYPCMAYESHHSASAKQGPTVMDLEAVTLPESLMVGDALRVSLIVAVGVGLENMEGVAEAVDEIDALQLTLDDPEGVREVDVEPVALAEPLRLALAVHDLEGDGVALVLAHVPSPTDTVTASMPSAACSWLPLRAQVMVMVTVGAAWARVRSMARATSSPAFTAAPLGFWGAPQPLPREVTPAPLPLSKVPTTTPSMATV
jgi:hypothetical protein